MFTTCKKEEEIPNNPNDNSNLTLGQTIWNMTSYQETLNSSQTWNINLPNDDDESIRWIFLDNGTFFDNGTMVIQNVSTNGQMCSDTLSYYLSNNQIFASLISGSITPLEPCHVDLGFFNDTLNIIQHTNNNLSCSWQSDNVLTVCYFTKLAWQFKSDTLTNEKTITTIN